MERVELILACQAGSGSTPRPAFFEREVDFYYGYGLECKAAYIRGLMTGRKLTRLKQERQGHCRHDGPAGRDGCPGGLKSNALGPELR